MNWWGETLSRQIGIRLSFITILNIPNDNVGNYDPLFSLMTMGNLESQLHIITEYQARTEILLKEGNKSIIEWSLRLPNKLMTAQLRSFFKTFMI